MDDFENWRRFNIGPKSRGVPKAGKTGCSIINALNHFQTLIKSLYDCHLDTKILS